jgi:hypothetical protein
LRPACHRGGANLYNPAPKESENCTILGQIVLQPGGQPLKKVAILIFSDDEEHSYAALSDAEGHVKIEDVKPGHYNVHIERNGFLEAEKHGRRYRDETLTLKPAQELKDLVFRMRPGAVMTGKIMDDEGDPILKASVQVFRQHSGSSQINSQFYSHETNDLGEYRIFGLPSGRYLVFTHVWWAPAMASAGNENTASKPDTVYAPSYYPATMYKSQAAAIELHAGDQVPANFS